MAIINKFRQQFSQTNPLKRDLHYCLFHDYTERLSRCFRYRASVRSGLQAKVRSVEGSSSYDQEASNGQKVSIVEQPTKRRFKLSRLEYVQTFARRRRRYSLSWVIEFKRKY